MSKNFFERYYGNARATKVIYGTILIAAFLITKDHGGEASALALASGTFFAAVAIVVAEVYAEMLGETIKHKKKPDRLERAEIEKDTLAIVSVSLLPTLVFLISYAGAFSTKTAFLVSYALLLAILNVFSYWAARLSGRTVGQSIVRSILVTIIGLAVVLIKYSLGH